VTAIYGWLLRLYPDDYRCAFGAAMRDAFQARLVECGRRGRLPVLSLLVRECLSLVRCAGGEWIDKVTAPPFQRDMAFRDPSRMRPPGADKRYWYAGL
jgi:hypothetical protein